MDQTPHVDKSKQSLGSLELLGSRLDFHLEGDGMLYACRPDGAEVMRVASAVLSGPESASISSLIALPDLVETAARWLLDRAARSC